MYVCMYERMLHVSIYMYVTCMYDSFKLGFKSRIGLFSLSTLPWNAINNLWEHLDLCVPHRIWTSMILVYTEQQVVYLEWGRDCVGCVKGWLGQNKSTQTAQWLMVTIKVKDYLFKMEC